jgi:aqualysin 1
MKAKLTLVALALAACSEPISVSAPTAPAAPERAVDGAYIVVVREGASPVSVAATAGIHPRLVFSAVLNGFVATLNGGQLMALRQNPAVAYVEPDGPARLIGTQTPATWGLDRIDQVALPLSNSYSYANTGKGVNAYVLDSGVNSRHQGLYPRALFIPNGASGDFVGDGHGSAEDCNGHGTHVAGTLGSTTYGVAKEVTLYAGRVVDCAGFGSASMALDAMEWIAHNGKRPAVVNMSLGYGDRQSVRDAATSLVSYGYFVAAGAGNGNYAQVPQNACLESPGGAPAVMTVGSTTSSDHESYFSNYGRCVDILAPGSSITSTWIGSSTATYTLSGTSMATPHVAGAAALYLSIDPSASPAQVTNALLSISTRDRITLNAASLSGGTPNRLLFSPP